MTGEFDFDPRRPSPLKKKHQQAYRGEPVQQPDLELTEDWWHECQRLHHRQCNGRVGHDTQKWLDAWHAARRHETQKERCCSSDTTSATPSTMALDSPVRRV